jgi:argininosuccinate synthase
MIDLDITVNLSDAPKTNNKKNIETKWTKVGTSNVYTEDAKRACVAKSIARISPWENSITVYYNLKTNHRTAL